MLPLSVARNYYLRLPDGRALGHVRIDRLIDSWAEGPFTPAPAFEDFRELFDREAQLRHEQVIPLWEQAADAIEALGIQVVEEGERSSHSQLRVFVEGSDAIIGTQLSPP